jgi:hypothetical protein
MEMKSIFRFYKWNKENIDALKKPYIFLYSAKSWEDAGEFDFEINIGSEESYRNFLIRQLRKGYSLQRDSDEYKIFRTNCVKTLYENNLLDYIDTPIELDTIADIKLNEAASEEGIKERKELIKNNFFNKTGICCFTSESTTLEDRFHWDSLTIAGTGFCIEYNWPHLNEYFRLNNRYIEGRHIKYYDLKLRPQLNVPNENLDETVKNFYDIFYALKQSLKDEKEFRIAKVYRETIDKNDPLRREMIPIECIISVTLGPNIVDENAAIIFELCHRLYPEIPLYKIVKQDSNYLRSLLS